MYTKPSIVGVFIFSGLAVFFVIQPLSIAQGQEAKAELRPLENYLGTWDSEFVIISDRPSDSEKTYTGTTSGKWAVGGAFLNQTGRYELGNNIKPLVITTMMGFNKSTQQFDYYYFYSSGEIMKGKSTWNADKKTMTTIGMDEKGQQEIEITADFSEKGIEKWVMLIKDKNGNARLRVKGKNTRRKKQ